MTIKEAIFREIKFGLCTSGSLNGIVAPDHVALDERLHNSSMQAESDYPWIIFARISAPEDTAIHYVRARIEIDLIGLITSATKGDELLEQIRDVLVTHFGGKRKRIGKYTAGGAPDANGGLLIAMEYLDTSERFNRDVQEKVQTLVFDAKYFRTA